MELTENIHTTLKRNKANRKVITTTISPENYEYVSKNGLKYSDLLARSIAQHQLLNAEDNSRRIEAMRQVISKLHRFLEKKGLSDEYFKSLD